MKELLEFLLKGLLGEEKFEIVEAEDGGRILYTIKTAPENIGLIIGKGGHMIKSLRNILKVRATLEKTAVSINVEQLRSLFSKRFRINVPFGRNKLLISRLGQAGNFGKNPFFSRSKIRYRTRNGRQGFG